MAKKSTPPPHIQEKNNKNNHPKGGKKNTFIAQCSYYDHYMVKVQLVGRYSDNAAQRLPSIISPANKEEMKIQLQKIIEGSNKK